MSGRRVAALACACAVVAAAPVASEPVSLPALLSRARERAPGVAVALARIDDARAATITAAARLPENPELAAAVGPRWAGDGRLTDVRVGASQFFEPGARRRARQSAAAAGVQAAAAAADRVLRDVLGDIAGRYHRLGTSLRLADVLARAAETAAEIEGAATRRFALGDVAVLDVNVTRATRARAAADLAAARADVARQLAQLAAALDWSELVHLGITRTAPGLRVVDDAVARDGLAASPELAELDARIRVAEAEARQARASRSPEVGVSVDYEREEGAAILMAGLLVRLPVVQRGVGASAEAAARAATLRAERQAAQAAASGRLSGELAAYRFHREAVLALETDVLPAVDENEHLARRSYETGQINLADWLLYRREALDARRVHLEHQLLAALTLVEIDSLSGVLR